MKDLVAKNFFKKNELYEFIKETFKEGTVPQSKEEFEACFSDNTTDGSLCFANQFGKGEDDAVMLFFYPTFCAIPPRYNKNLRNQEECSVGLVVAEYQKLLAAHTDNLSHLELLKEEIDRRQNMAFLSFDFHRDKNFRMFSFNEEDKGREALKETVESYKRLISKHSEVRAFVDERMSALKNQSEYDFSEPTTVKDDKKRLR